MKETELAKIFVDYLSCYDLYFEVDYHRCIDIVAIDNNISMAYEVKTTFNFKVLEQAIANRRHFNYSYICVPNFFDSSFQEKLCEDYGIGLIMFSSDPRYEKFQLRAHPKINRHARIKDLKERLSEINKKAIPGSKNGESEKITAFGKTVESLCLYVRRNPGCTLKDTIENCSHHYSSNHAARACLSKWIRKGIIKDVSIENGRVLYRENQESLQTTL